MCLTCSETEEIPIKVVRNFDETDHGDPTVPPQVSCEACGGGMYPEYYKVVRSHEYNMNDVRQT